MPKRSAAQRLLMEHREYNIIANAGLPYILPRNNDETSEGGTYWKSKR